MPPALHPAVDPSLFATAALLVAAASLTAFGARRRRYDGWRWWEEFEPEPEPQEPSGGPAVKPARSKMTRWFSQLGSLSHTCESGK